VKKTLFLLYVQNITPQLFTVGPMMSAHLMQFSDSSNWWHHLALLKIFALDHLFCKQCMREMLYWGHFLLVN